MLKTVNYIYSEILIVMSRLRAPIVMLLTFSIFAISLTYLRLYLSLLSDHSLIYIIRKSNWRVIDANNSATKRQFKNFNDDEFLNDFREINWSDIHSLVNPNDMW